jgi:hypothetical protein
LPLARPVGLLSEPEDLRTLEDELASTARRTWRHLPDGDVAAAVDAGMLASATAASDALAHAANGPVIDSPVEVGRIAAGEVGAAAAVIQRHGLPPSAVEPVGWSGFGVVVPVLAGSPAVGASVLTAVLADVLQVQQYRVLMVDLADPSRSGLAIAARSAGPWTAQPHPHVRIRFSWRAQALLARLETALPVVAPGMVPPPRFWLPQGQSPQVTVVDLGHDPWRIAAHPLASSSPVCTAIRSCRLRPG